MDRNSRRKLVTLGRFLIVRGGPSAHFPGCQRYFSGKELSVQGKPINAFMGIKVSSIWTNRI